MRGNAGGGEDVLLLVAEAAFVGMGGDRCAGLARGDRGRFEQRPLVGRDAVGAGRDLDDARFDVGVADALGQLVDEELGDRRRRRAEARAELPVGRSRPRLLCRARSRR